MATKVETMLSQVLENQEEIKGRMDKLERYNQHEIYELNHLVMEVESITYHADSNKNGLNCSTHKKAMTIN